MKRCIILALLVLLLIPVAAQAEGGYKSTQAFTLVVQHNTFLTWNASITPGVVGYFIYRGTTSGGESSTPLNATPVPGLSYLDLAVVAGTKYYYFVTAVAANGITQSGPSNEASDTIPTP